MHALTVHKSFIAAGFAIALALPAAHAAPFVIGDVFAALPGSVQHYNSGGTLLETLTVGSSFNTGMAFDAAGNLYVTNFGNNQVIKVTGPADPHTNSLFASQGGQPESIVFDAAGNSYVSSASTGLIAKYGPAGGAPIGSVDVGSRADFIDLAADQNTLFYTTESNFIGRYNFSGNTALTNFASGYSCSTGGGINTFALRLQSGGGALAAVNGCVLRFDTAGNVVKEYDITGVNGFFALNLDSDGTSFYTGSFSNGNLYKFDIDSGSLLKTIATGGSSGLFGVAVFGEITVGGPGPGTVPEPGSLALIVTALFGCVALRRRRSH